MANLVEAGLRYLGRQFIEFADGGSSVKCGFELASTVLDGVDHRPLIDCQSCWRFPQLFDAAIGSKKEPSSLGLTGGAAPPPYKKARKISGPFLLPEIPNPRGVAGIEAAGTNLPEGAKTADFWLSPVSFLCFAAGTIGLNPWFFNGLALPFCFMSCTPVAQNKPVTHQNAPPTRVAPASQQAADCAETTTGSCTGAAFQPECSG